MVSINANCSVVQEKLKLVFSFQPIMFGVALLIKFLNKLCVFHLILKQFGGVPQGSDPGHLFFLNK